MRYSTGKILVLDLEINDPVKFSSIETCFYPPVQLFI